MELNRKRNTQNDILGDINNISYPSPERIMKKGKPIMSRNGFEGSDDRFISHIPPPPSSITLHDSKASLEKNRRLSSIPAPSTISSNLNLQHINKLIGIKDVLNRRPEQSVSSLSLRSRLSMVEKSYTRDISKQTEIKHDLDNTISELTNKIDDLEKEVLDLKRMHKRYNHKLSELRNQITYSEKKFEHLEESVMKNVLHKEQMINIQIKEFENKLTDQYNEMNFLLLEELKTAKSYKDTNISEEIKQLNLKIETLNNQLHETKARKEQTLKSESKDLEEELNKCLESKSNEITKLTNIYQEKQEILNKATNSLDMLQKDIETISKQNKITEENVRNLDSNLSRFDETKSILLEELESSKSMLKTTLEEDKLWEEKVEDAKNVFEDVNNKCNIYKDQKRIIENSIMDYEGKTRVYALIPEILDENTFYFKGETFKFNKTLNINSPHKDIVDEFKCLTNSSLNGSNVSIFFSGEHSKFLLENSIVECFKALKSKGDSIKNWNYKFYLKCIGIDHTCKDLLNCNKSIKFESLSYNLDQLHSQKMTVTDERSLSEIFETLKEVNEAKVYILNIDAISVNDMKSFVTDIMFTDLTYKSYDDQFSYLKTFKTHQYSEDLISRLLEYSYSNSKCLFLANISNPNINLDWIEQLQELNYILSPYRKYR